MNNILAIKRPGQPRETILLYARVEESDGDAHHVHLNNGVILTAQRAGGCLLVPERGDEVLVADNGERAFILTVLTREGDAGRIALPGASVIEGEEMTLTARRGMNMEATRISIAGVLGEVRFKGISLISQWCDTRISKITVVAEIWDRVVGRLTERIRDSYRRIENTEQTTAGRIRTMVKGRFSVAARNAALTAEEEVNMDGKKIHIG